jgi:hypothetical protein
VTRRAPRTRDDGDVARPAYYAEPSFLHGRWVRDAWTLLHPPYTAWHLAYVVVGACLLGPVSVARLVATLLAFFLAVGVGAHALDELHGRPLRTTVPDSALVAAAAVGLGGAVVLGVVGIVVVGGWLAAFVTVGVVLALGYNLELAGGVLHTDVVFAAAWGAFPVLTAYFAQHGTLSVAALLAGAFGYLTASAQRTLSTPARAIRRRTAAVEGTIVPTDGAARPVTARTILDPLEGALRALSWAMVAVAAALALARLGPWH